MLPKNPYTFSIGLATLIAWASWLVVINKMSPFLSGYLSLALFYSSLFIALTGTFALLIYYLRTWIRKNTADSHYLNIALREGVLLSLMVDVGLIFQRLRVLTWWDFILLFAIILLIEFYFLARE
ncbi:hypothetical protein COY07_05115 [Candidatus Peregrinibacteria bacterium CG_4_10_14_0_2_um_filter_43_11]|nr:MAG: hypothetical protein COY07_05115 [Candidatus Peregrinibacteria bacterium CG_4_10_14_0_2_um_filter_43_11]